jgi:hypothetical protein
MLEHALGSIETAAQPVARLAKRGVHQPQYPQKREEAIAGVRNAAAGTTPPGRGLICEHRRGCVVGASEIQMDEVYERFTIGEQVVRHDEWITLDGGTGRVIRGKVPTVEPEFGHFFQRPRFNDYGEGGSGIGGSLNTFVRSDGHPLVLGNRNLRPQRTVAYEVGLERNFWDFFLLTATGYYKHIRHVVRDITVQAPLGQYRTTINADYADHAGIEFSIRKVPSTYSFGTVSGYANFTTQTSMSGRSSEPIHLDPDPDRNKLDTQHHLHPHSCPVTAPSKRRAVSRASAFRHRSVTPCPVTQRS